MTKRQQICKKLVKNAKAVSPIIATLMLVLITVGAAGAFYLWQTGWQGTVTSKVGNANVQSSLTIGGSTTMYEFGATAAQYFEAANPNVAVNVQKGGSGAGLVAVGTGAIDIGMISAPYNTIAGYTNYPDLNKDGVKDIGSDFVQTKAAYDAVVVIVSSANTHALDGVSTNVMKDLYHYNGGFVLPTGVGTVWTPSFGGFGVAGVTVPLTWGQLPRQDYYVTGSNAAGTSAITLDVAYTLTPLPTAGDTVYVQDSAGAWTRGTVTSLAGVNLVVSQTIVAAGASNTKVWFCCPASATQIKIYDRSDVSGTEETFNNNILANPTKGQLEDNAIDVTKTGGHVDSNQNMVATISGSNDALGFAAYGVAKQSTTVAMPKLLLTKSDINNNGVKGEYPTDEANPAAGTTGVASTSFTTASKTPQTADSTTMLYGGGKAIYFLTVGQPSGEAKIFIDYCLAPEMNANICTAAGYINLY